MNQTEQGHYHSVVHQRLGVNFVTKEMWLDDKPEKGEAPTLRLEEAIGEAFVADLPEVVLDTELEEVHKFIKGLLESGNKMSVIQAMANIHYVIEFLFNTDPAQAWAKYRRGVELRQRHYDVVIRPQEEAGEA
jgi:hypothetical protein